MPLVSFEKLHVSRAHARAKTSDCFEVHQLGAAHPQRRAGTALRAPTGDESGEELGAGWDPGICRLNMIKIELL